MIDLISSGWLLVAVPIATALLCLASALGIASAVLLNRGAKVNVAWSLVAVGLAAIGITEGDRVLAVLGLPNLTELRDVIRLCGALLVFSGVLYGRDLLKRLAK